MAGDRALAQAQQILREYVQYLAATFRASFAPHEIPLKAVTPEKKHSASRVAQINAQLLMTLHDDAIALRVLDNAILYYIVVVVVLFNIHLYLCHGRKKNIAAA